MNLSVVIPAYNEEENIEKAINDVIAVYPEAEIIVVNDASTDNTLKVLEHISVKQLTVLSNDQNMGHGDTVIKGIKAANGDYVLYIDADRQIDLPKSLPIGVPFVSGYRKHRNDKLFRKVISFCLKMTILLRWGYYVKDANCPFKLYQKPAVMMLINKLPTTYIIPIACLEVLARRNKFETEIMATPHHPYDGVRKGFLQSFNSKMYRFLWSAFKEITSL